MSPSDVDLWDWLVNSHPRGSTVTILILCKDGFGVCAEDFIILDRQTQRAGINVQLVICHDVETQAGNHGMRLSPSWIYSRNGLGKYFAVFWLSILAANMRGLANDPHYQTFSEELRAKASARDNIGAVVRGFQKDDEISRLAGEKTRLGRRLSHTQQAFGLRNAILPATIVRHHFYYISYTSNTLSRK